MVSWVNFHHFPVHFFSKQSLFSISTLGVTMKTSTATATVERPSVNRVCIMDVLKKFPPRIWIGNGSKGF